MKDLFVVHVIQISIADVMSHYGYHIINLNISHFFNRHILR